MSLLDDIYMPPIRIDGTRVQRVMPLGPYPEYVALTPRQIAQRQAARLKQVGKTKAPNRVKR